MESEIEDTLYNNAQTLIQKADSLNNLSEEEKRLTKKKLLKKN